MQPRIEQKLSVDAREYVSIVQWLAQRQASLLYPPRRVSSTYFDTPQLSMFQDTVEGIVPRRKVRIRCYGTHTSSCESSHQLETKLTTETGRKKQSCDIDDDHLAEANGLMDDQYGWLVATLHVSYEREYFAISGIRMTIDRFIRYRSSNSLSQAWCDDEQIAVELKAPSTTSLDWLANEFPLPRIHFSKYERGILRTGATTTSDA